MRVYAFVPARSGSRGLPHKNVLDLDGHPLMAYAIAFGQALGVDRVIVSTDSDEYAEIARRYGADCPYLRGAEASTDTAMEELILSDMSRNLPDHGIEMPDIWVRLKPTNPFRRVDTVRRGLEAMTSTLPPDSVRIVSKIESRTWTINDQGWLAPLISGWDPDRSVMRRTEFPEAYSPFNLDIFFHANWLRWGSAYMGQRILPIVDHVITGMDINDADDLDVIRAMVRPRPRPDIVSRYLVEPR